MPCVLALAVAASAPGVPPTAGAAHGQAVAFQGVNVCGRVVDYGCDDDTHTVLLKLGRKYGPAVMGFGIPAVQRPAPRQAPASQVYRLAAMCIDGARRNTASDVIKLSGLEVGQQVTPAQLDEAAGRLGATGLFAGVSYRFVTQGKDLTLTFEIQEAERSVPVVFDNFVWLTDEEIMVAVRRAIPSFDGSAPPSAEFPDLLVRVLQDLLKARSIEGRSEFLPLTDLKTGRQQFVFRVGDPGPRLCELRIDGASALTAAELIAAARTGLTDEYSRVRATAVANGTLRDLYRQRGHWRATFAGPAVTLVRAASCTGVAATLHVDEGPAYGWERAEWAGNATHPSASLDAMIGMKPGDLAEMSRIEAGLRGIRASYGRQGYVLQEATYAASLDEERRRATFQIRIVEGPLFRAGSVEVLGIPDAAARAMLEKWGLRPGDVYNADYPFEYVEREMRPMLRRGAASLRPPSVETRIDEARRVVDVRFVFK